MEEIIRVDFGAHATFKGENQKPLVVAERFFGLRRRPSIKEIAHKAMDRGLDAVVLRSYSHPGGTDERWSAYAKQMQDEQGFTDLGRGVALYISQDRHNDSMGHVFLIHGQGLMTDEGNINVLFANGKVGGRGQGYELDFDFLIDQARVQGGLVIASKPYDWDRNALKKVDAIETWNGLAAFQDNSKAQDIVYDMRKPGVHVSGSKCLWNLGGSYSILTGALDTRAKDADQIMRTIKDGLYNQDHRNVQGKMRRSTFSKLIQALAIAEVKVTGNKD